MQPPIPVGTLLQNRYHLLKVLGQGGFGRTYLAEDRGRFNEHCVVKEYIPVQAGTYALEKSKELFQREAAILYQVQHPQIPQFRVTFEQGRRLFFVQDYVEGKTYSAWLQERKRQGRSFAEAEVLHLMEQLLPVLAYIHSQNIIHRDVSPDNLILRESDRLPVLIDFGGVKEVANQLQADGTVYQGTTVGKIGFAPPEQLQTGKVYPSSDLYALAVTVIVLLTGMKPQDLFDEVTFSWHWQQRLPTLSPWLVRVLNRMLNSKPHNRYQSATEVAQVLRSLTGLVSSSDAPSPNLEEGQTPNPQARNSVTSPQRVIITSRSSSKTSQNSEFWGQPWVGWALGLGGLSLFGIVPWMIVNSLLSTPIKLRQKPVTPSPVVSPLIIESPSPTLASKETSTVASASPEIDAEPINFSTGQDKLQASARTSPQKIKRYLVNGVEGERIGVQILRGAVSLDIRDGGGQLLQEGTGVSSWQSSLLSKKENYQIDVVAFRDTDFTLEISVQTSTSTTPSPTPIATPDSSPPLSPPSESSSPTPIP